MDKKISTLSNNNIGKDLTKFCLKIDVILLTCVLEKVTKVSIIEFGVNPLYGVNLRGFTWQC